ncbi:MAG: hypothetical protein IKZ46_13045 [Victivallales bacterium]|nr:hypothetical protein [Victivallales bacterium]
MKKRTERLARIERLRLKRLRRWPKHLKGRKKGLERIRMHDRAAAAAVKSRQRGNAVKAKAPVVFDLEKATAEMLEFFHTVRETIRDGKPIDIDMSDVTDISVSSLLYLVAIMQDAKLRGDVMDVHGNMPVHKRSRDIMEASGFFNYVRRQSSTLPFFKTTSILQITSGRQHDSMLVSKLCAFIRKALEMNRNGTRYVFKIITELMQNTIGHAYPDHKGEDRMWYMSAQLMDDEVDIAFLDTGVGIPKTVQKKLKEEISEFISLTGDEDFLMSALEGIPNRTQTGKRYRGKGLPTIYQLYQKGKISKLAIMSGMGYINGMDKKRLKKKMFGTLFRFRIGVTND